MFDQGDLKQIPQWKFESYYKWLEKKQNDIKDAIEKLAKKLGPDNKPQISKDSNDDFISVIKNLMHKEMEG